jgi:dephospho-CoA kinase
VRTEPRSVSRSPAPTIALTGNIGCGKSTVAAMLADLGATIIDADALVHEMLAEGGEAVEAVLAEFPGASSPAGRAVDRKALGAFVFADPARRRALEAILHPRVQAREAELAAQARARGAARIVVEAALLFEAWRNGGPDPRARFDAIVVVTCDAESQLARVVARGLTEEAARARIAAQMPQSEKAARADHVIDNAGSLAATRAQVELLHSALARKN